MSYFVYATLGEMTVKDLLAECHEQGWAPVLVARPKTPGQPTLIPCFQIREHAAKFVERNLCKKQLFGTLTLDEKHLAKLNTEWIEQRGWKIEYLDHPRLLKGTHDLDVEVFELDVKPDVYALRNRHGTDARTLASVD